MSQQTTHRRRGLQFKSMLQDDIDLNSRKCCIRTTECGVYLAYSYSLYGCTATRAAFCLQRTRQNSSVSRLLQYTLFLKSVRHSRNPDALLARSALYLTHSYLSIACIVARAAFAIYFSARSSQNATGYRIYFVLQISVLRNLDALL